MSAVCRLPVSANSTRACGSMFMCTRQCIQSFLRNIADIISILRRRCSCSFCCRTPGPSHLFLPVAKENQVLSMAINKTPVVKTKPTVDGYIRAGTIQKRCIFYSSLLFPCRKNVFSFEKCRQNLRTFANLHKPLDISKLCQESTDLFQLSHPLFELLDLCATNVNVRAFTGFPCCSIFLHFPAFFMKNFNPSPYMCRLK